MLRWLIQPFSTINVKLQPLLGEHQRLASIIELYNQAEKASQDLADNRDLLAEADTDEELKEMAQEEIAELEPALETLKEQLLVAMLPQDDSDHRNIIMEIRAGAGGNEASLFAGDLSRMYHRFAENRGWRVEQMGSNLSEAGGFKEISFMISGEDVYKTLKLRAVSIVFNEFLLQRPTDEFIPLLPL